MQSKLPSRVLILPFILIFIANNNLLAQVDTPKNVQRVSNILFSEMPKEAHTFRALFGDIIVDDNNKSKNGTSSSWAETEELDMEEPGTSLAKLLAIHKNRRQASQKPRQNR